MALWMLKLKDATVNPDFTPPMMHAHITVALAYMQYGLECVLTSGRDGAHMTNSLHGSGNAGDYRTYHVPQEIRLTLIPAIKAALGPRYDVLYEDNPGHLHVEYDPKPAESNHV